MKRLWHIPWLILTFAASLVVLIAFDPFAGPSTGILVAFWLSCFAVAHFLALTSGFFFTRRGSKRILLVSGLALAPLGVFTGIEVKDRIYLRHFAVYDRFRENLVDPIPDTVSNLRFVPLDEAIETHLMFRFSIAPEDLELVLAHKGFHPVSRNNLRRMDDYFVHPEYLPLKEPSMFYIINDIAGGYPDEEIGEGYTLKVSFDRSEVIFRRESAAYYKYEYWKSDWSQKNMRDFLDSLKGKSEPGAVGNEGNQGASNDF